MSIDARSKTRINDMHSTDFLTQLRQTLNEEDCRIVILAIRQDPLIWKSLKDTQYARSAFAFAGSNARNWNPAALTFLSIFPECTIEDLPSILAKPLNSELRQRAINQFEQSLLSGQQPANLEEAALVALALKERRRIRGSWQGLREEIMVKANEAPTTLFRRWSTPVACTYNLTSDQSDFLKALVPVRNSCNACDLIGLCIHAVLSSPAPEIDHINAFVNLLDHLNPEIQLQFLNLLNGWGRSVLATQLARALLDTEDLESLVVDLLSKQERNSPLFIPLPISIDPLEQDESPLIVEKLQQLSAYYRIAGDYEQAKQSLSLAHEAFARLEAKLFSQIASLADVNLKTEDSIQTWEKVVNLVPDSLIARTKFANALVGTGRYSEASTILPTVKPIPLSIITDIKLSQGIGDSNQVNRLSLDSLNTITFLENELQSAKYPIRVESLPEPGEVINTLVDLEMAPEVINYAEKVVDRRFADQGLLRIAIKAYLAAHLPSDGIETALTAVLANPGELDLHRLLAEVLEASNAYEQSFTERQFVIDQVTPPSVDDLLAYASIALKIDQPDITIAASEACLQENPENGLAFVLIGEALLHKQDLLGAIDRFTIATSLIPEQPGPWLALSRSLAKAGDQQKSLETLRTAAHAVPQSPDILLALGEQSLNSGYPSEALPPLREAFSIDKKSPTIALRLSETLFQLGHYEEANQVLTLTREVNPNFPELAYVNGQVLLALNEKGLALQALLESVKTPKPAVDSCILLAKTLKSIYDEQKADQSGLGCEVDASSQKITNNELQAVIASLDEVLQAEPTNFEVNLLLAETYALSQLNQQAYNSFVRLSEDAQSTELTWRSRIHFGLGKVSTKLGQVETAVASLQEANTIDPDNLEIRQSLTEAFQAANLRSEALEAARSTLHMAPDNLNIITWFTRTALSLNDLPEAIETLEHALQLTPERTDFVIWLGQIHIQSGDLVAGRQYLSQILTIPNVQINHYRKAASLLGQIEDFQNAATCLEMALNVDSNPCWDLFYELAMIYERAGKHLAALDNIQKAIVIQPDNLQLCVLQGDILARLDRNLAALACLEHSLQIIQLQPVPSASSNDDFSEFTTQTNFNTQFSQEITPAKIHIRISILLRTIGELHPAFEHAQEALNLDPEDIEIRALAVELAYGLLEDELALRLSEWNTLNNQFMNSELNFEKIQVPSALTILAIMADLYLESGNYPIAEQTITQALAIDPNHPHLLALQSRVDLRKGNIAAATQCLNQLVNKMAMNLKPDEDDLLSLDKNISNHQHNLWLLLTMAQASLELHQWQASLALFQQAASIEPQQPRPHLLYARALVTMAEMQETCKALKISSHAPGENRLSDEFNKRFEEEIMLSNRLCNYCEINHWKSRGQVAFQPCNETIKRLAEEITQPGDVSSMIAGYRKTGNLPGARKAAELSGDEPEVMFQLALALQDESPEESIGIIRRLLENDPTNPLYIAMLAFLCQQEPIESLKLIEIALGLWPDEVEWHKYAAELSAKLGDKISATFHWKRIVEIKPDDLSFAISLGCSYLENNDPNQAIQVFEHATRRDPEQSLSWKLLAKAHKVAGNYPEANSSIEHALLLNPEDLESILISGQTSLQLNQFDMATQRAKNILANHPTDPDALLLFAQVMKQSGQPGEALKLIDQALPVLNNPFPLLLERANLLKQTQGNQIALPYLIELANSNPDEVELLILLANTFSEVGQMDYAERTAQAVLQLDPENTKMHLLLGHIERLKGQLDQSVHHLNEVIRQTPLQVDAYLELGRAYQERREHLQALKILRQAMQIAPDDFRPFYQAGLALRESKDYLGAETMFRRAAHLAPDDLNIRRQLGAIITLNLVHHTQEATISHE
jgi:tetratricopeptide (TPR) repeat protein